MNIFASFFGNYETQVDLDLDLDVDMIDETDPDKLFIINKFKENVKGKNE